MGNSTACSTTAADDRFFAGSHNSANNAEGSDFEVFEGTIGQCACGEKPVRKGEEFEHALDRMVCNGEHADIVDAGWFWEDADTLSESFDTAKMAYLDALEFFSDRLIAAADDRAERRDEDAFMEGMS